MLTPKYLHFNCSITFSSIKTRPRGDIHAECPLHSCLILHRQVLLDTYSSRSLYHINKKGSICYRWLLYDSVCYRIILYGSICYKWLSCEIMCYKWPIIWQFMFRWLLYNIICYRLLLFNQICYRWFLLTMWKTIYTSIHEKYFLNFFYN